MSDFGIRLKKYRKALGYSQYTLAEKLGVSRRTIKYYECEAKNAPAQLLTVLSQTLQVSVNVLLGTEEPKLDGRTIDSKFWPKWEKLSFEDRKVLNKMADALINKS